MRKNQLSDPYVIFLVTAAMFFNGSRIPPLVLFKIPQGTFITTLVYVGHVVSEKNSFRRNHIKKKKKKLKKGQ